MKIFFFIFLSTFFCLAAEIELKTPAQIKAIFNKYNAEGTFVLYNLNSDKYTIHNLSRSDSAAIPASTFKIFNSLVILEEGIVKDEKEIFKWDGKKRWAKSWNKDHNMSSAIKKSAVWFYQECARRVGQELMQFWVNKVEYGNKSITGGIDRFWLDGGIRITAKQQVYFLKNLYYNKLPFSQRSMNIVKEITIRDKNKNYTLHAKTGWADSFTPQIGWYVGYLERNNNVYFFAMNIDIHKNDDAKKRKKITYEILGLE